MNKKSYILNLLLCGLLFVCSIFIIVLLLNTSLRKMIILYSFLFSLVFVSFIKKSISTIYFIKLNKYISSNSSIKDINKLSDKFGTNKNNQKRNDLIYKFIFLIIFLLLIIITSIGNFDIKNLIFEIFFLVLVIIYFIIKIKHV